MKVADGYAALAEIQKRFGKRMDPREAFAHIDLTLANGHAANIGLKQVICACAFDRGTLAGMFDRVAVDGTAAPDTVLAFLALPIAPPDPPAEPQPEPSRIIRST